MITLKYLETIQLFQIMHYLPAGEEKERKGVNNVAEGAWRSFQFVQDMIEYLKTKCKLSSEWADHLSNATKHLKVYLKTQYIRELSMSDNCASHCCALGMSTSQNFHGLSEF